jgi:hypothetical protein
MFIRQSLIVGLSEMAHLDTQRLGNVVECLATLKPRSTPDSSQLRIELCHGWDPFVVHFCIDDDVD